MSKIAIQSDRPRVLWPEFLDAARGQKDHVTLKFEGASMFIATFSEVLNADPNIFRHLKGQKIYILDQSLDRNQRQYLQDLKRFADLDLVCYYQPTQWYYLWWFWLFFQVGFWLVLAAATRGRILLSDIL